eukprot:TRINITY_DN9400_c0_g1_i1.p1 TRINITY_DN9400_c0_g1~~TRINITY_DN9400_c0_g1_i1.p1  ORF type:complete len:1214 (+),score=285.68 TRINITY_DN9400_c0_g1_i1:86-3727(+)
MEPETKKSAFGGLLFWKFFTDKKSKKNKKKKRNSTPEPVVSTPFFDHDSYWRCDGCRDLIRPKTYRWTCHTCFNFDFCEDCMNTEEGKIHAADHKFSKELAYGPVQFQAHSFSTSCEVLIKAFETYSYRWAYGVRPRDERGNLLEYQWMTYEEVGSRSKNLSLGLRSLIKMNDFVGICSNNRPEWFFADFACVFQHFVSVPIHTTFSLEETIFVVTNSNVKLMVTSGEYLDRFLKVAAHCPCLKFLVCMDDIDPAMKAKLADQHKVEIYTMKELEGVGKNSPLASSPNWFVPAKPKDLITVIHTSGSTGFPKGVMIPEDYHFSDIVPSAYINEICRVSMSYRPLAHATDRVVSTCTLVLGGRVAFYSGDIGNLFDDIAVARPSSFSAPPRIWNMMYTEYKEELSKAMEGQEPDDLPLVEKMVLQKFTGRIPTRCNYVATGGAPISPAVWAFVEKAFPNCRTGIGYGSTECGSITINTGAYAGARIKLRSVPEMGYTVSDVPHARGEILVKNKAMALGYINNEEETRNAFDSEGFFCTGDIGEMTQENFITVIDRKKNIFKLAQSVYVSPEQLEQIYVKSAFVDQIFIHGSSLEEYVVAVVVPNLSYAMNYAMQEGLIKSEDIKEQLQELANSDRLKIAILKDLRTLALEAKRLPWEIPPRIHIDFEQFTAANGKLTPSLKPCRHKLAAAYKEDLERLYAQNASSPKPKSDLGKNSLTAEEEKVITILNEVLRIDHIASVLNQTFSSLGGDSLSAVRFIQKVKSAFQVTIPFSMLFKEDVTLTAIVAYIRDPRSPLRVSLSRLRVSANTIVSYEDDLEWKLEIDVSGCQPATNMNDVDAVLLTGSTGFCGAFLLDELLRELPSAKIFCLVRAANNTEAEARIEKALKYYDLWNSLNNDMKSRIVAVAGDLSKENFALGADLFKLMASEIDVIYHCGAQVNGVLPYHLLRPSNVIGTLEIIKFACKEKLKPLHYISTLSVLPRSLMPGEDPTSTREKDLSEMENFYHMSGYSQSKHVAEKLAVLAREKGLPVAIYRFGSVSGHSVLGSLNPLDFYTKFFAGVIQLKAFPTVTSRLDIVPVDFVCKAVVNLSKKQSSFGKVFHLVNTNQPVLMKQVMKCIQAGYPMEEMDYSLWKKRLTDVVEKGSDSIRTSQKLESNALEPLLPYFSGGFPMGEATYARQNLEEGIKGTSVRCPPITDEIILRYLKFMKSREIVV